MPCCSWGSMTAEANTSVAHIGDRFMQTRRRLIRSGLAFGAAWAFAQSKAYAQDAGDASLFVYRDFTADASALQGASDRDAEHAESRCRRQRQVQLQQSRRDDQCGGAGARKAHRAARAFARLSFPGTAGALRESGYSAFLS